MASELNGAMNLDAQETTRTIRAEARHPGRDQRDVRRHHVWKAGAVLRMVEDYLGEEIFRQGVHNYLQAHMYGMRRRKTSGTRRARPAKAGRQDHGELH